MHHIATNIEDYDEETETEFWISLSLDSFQKAYDEVEPDYSDVKVIEPNPKYSI